MKENITVSIIIPTHNNHSYIGEAILSAINAVLTFTELTTLRGEIIIIDDASKPNLFLGDYGPVDNKKFDVNLVRLHENQGQERATNLGISLARGDYCLILHGDDVLNPCAIYTLFAPLKNHESIVMSVGERSEIDQAGIQIKGHTPLYDGDYLIPGASQADVFLVTGFLPCQVLFKRTKYLKIGGVEIGYPINLDGLLWFKLSFEGDIVYQRKEVCKYRRHPTSATEKANQCFLHLFDWYSTTKRMLTYAANQGLDLGDQRDRLIKRIEDLGIRFSGEQKNGDKLIDPFLLISYAATLHRDNNGTQISLDKFLKSKSEKFISAKNSQRNFSYTPPAGSKRLFSKCI
jgi:glycosyltransferase involved in cell wall biosynthesis